MVAFIWACPLERSKTKKGSEENLHNIEYKEDTTN
jgi:hypothetical protein